MSGSIGAIAMAVDILDLLVRAGFRDERESGAVRFACMGKRRFETKEQAAAARDQRRRQLGGRPMYFYPCKPCGGFHLTSTLPGHMRRNSQQEAAA